MERDERLKTIQEIIIEVMNENYRNYGSFNNMSEAEIQELIDTNLAGISQMADLVSHRIDDKLFS